MFVCAEVAKRADDGSVVKGRVVSKCGASGLIVWLSNGYKGCVQMTDIADEYCSDLLKQYAVHDVIWCYVIDARRKMRLVLSTRPSRLDRVAGLDV